MCSNFTTRFFCIFDWLPVTSMPQEDILDFCIPCVLCALPMISSPSKLQDWATKARRGFLLECLTAMQTRGMHTIIRDRETTTDNFVFYTDRLLRLASFPQMPSPKPQNRNCQLHTWVWRHLIDAQQSQILCFMDREVHTQCDKTNCLDWQYVVSLHILQQPLHLGAA